MNAITVDRTYLTETLKTLVQINSINPSLVADAPGEREIAPFVAQAMQEIGLDVNLDEIAPGRFNVVGIYKGAGGGRSLMLNAHMDTVGVYEMEEPFTPNIKDGKLYGRGAYDMKGSLAACLAAAKALADTGTPLLGDLILTAVADEEYISIGTEAVVKGMKSDAAIVTEPTGMRICIAHKGYEWIEIETTGRAAHGSRYQSGIDANFLMGRLLKELEAYSEGLIRREGHALTGPPSLHTSTIQGGQEWSIYPARCLLQIERRTIPGENRETVLGEIQTILDELTRQDPLFNAKLHPFFSRDPFEIPADALIVQNLQDAYTNHFGETPTLMGESFWMDSSILAQAGIETVIFGPSGEGAHTKVEWVDLDSVYDTACILAKTAMAYCNLPK